MTLLESIGLTAFLFICALWALVIYGFACLSRCERRRRVGQREERE